MTKVYGDIRSGNCYKIKLLLEQLHKPYEWIDVDILAGESRTPDFLAKNPNGRIPLVETSSGYLSESNAILLHLAEGTEFLPTEPWTRAKVYQWLFFEQYSHEPYIATSRFIMAFLGNPPERQADLKAKKEPGYQALEVMEQRLIEHSFFAGDHYSIADIALYAYTHVAHEGGFDLNPYPGIRAWLQRVANTPGYVGMS